MSVNTNSNKELLFELLNTVIDKNGFIIDISLLKNFINKQCKKFEKENTHNKELSAINSIILEYSLIIVFGKISPRSKMIITFGMNAKLEDTKLLFTK